MSVNYYANLVLGFSVPQEDFIVEQPVRGCGHPLMDEASFCPVCGKSMWEIERGRVELFFAGGAKLDVHEQNTVDFESSDEDMPRIVGARLSTKNGVVSLPSAIEQEGIKAQILAALEAGGIDVQTPFGLHLVRYVSY